MQTPDKSLAQKSALAKQRDNAISELFKLSPSFSCQGEIGQFVDKYILCEVIAKRIQHYYKVDTNKGHASLHILTLKASLNHFKIKFNEVKINDVFKGGEGKKGIKSARQLRNGYLHSLNENDKAEIEQRHSNLLNDINYFLQLARELFNYVSG